MPIVEIDEVELLNLRKLQGVAGKIMANPKGKLLLEQAYKEVDPNAPTPALDQQRAVREPVDEAMKKISALEAQLANEKAEREKQETLSALQSTIDKGYAKLREQGWTEEGIEGVRKLAEAKGILDPLDAAAIFEKDHPLPQPAAPSGIGGWNFIESVQDGEADLKKLLESKGQSEPLADKMAREALTEFRGATSRR